MTYPSNSNLKIQTRDRCSAFHVLAKPNGPICNLDCKYCYYLEKEKLYLNKGQWEMSYDILESFVRQKIESNDLPVEQFAWQGGEPTMLGVDYFRKVVDLQKKYANGKKIENAFQTNGILLDDRWCAFFAENDFLVGLSIDGPRKLHDHYRVNKGGKPTFDAVMRGIDFLTTHRVEFNTLTAVHRQNAHFPLEVYHFLKEIGSSFMQFIPIVERISQRSDRHGLKLVSPEYRSTANVSDWSVEPLQFGQFMISIFDEWVRKDVGTIFAQLFDVSLQSWMGEESRLCVFKKTCGNAMAIEHNGDLYSCDHYVYPDNKLGNIMVHPLDTLVNSPQQRKFGQNKLDSLPKNCFDCEFRFICNGECPKLRFIKIPNGDDRMNYLCEGYKKFFNHIDPYMCFMANELRHQWPPAAVMAWTKEKDFGFPSVNPRRNDPCPCGSSRKFKKCCGTVY